jgi:hypothetical protein
MTIVKMKSGRHVALTLALLAAQGCKRATSPAPAAEKPPAASPAAAAPPGWPDLGTGVAAGGGENDSALIVGLETYDYVPKVPGADANALAWHRYLTQDVGVPVERARLLVGKEATKEAMEKAITEAAQRARAGGRMWFVFIGHGAPAKTGTDGLLLGADVRQTAESLEARSVRQSEVVRSLEQSAAQPVLIVDACFSGRTGTGAPVVEGLQPVRLAAIAPPATAVILAAAGADQYAGPLPGAAKPAFSYLVLGALRGWADGDGDGQVTAGEVVTYTNRALAAVVTGREQTAELMGAGAVTLARQGREKGPDLGALARALAQGSVYEEDDDGPSALAATAASMALIKGGKFAGHNVGAFYMDTTEVTVAAYARCVADGQCKPASRKRKLRARAAFKSDDCNVNDPGRQDHPINCVEQAQAIAYCAAVGKRLPDEWEWEWAARGRDEQRTYPWGQEKPNCERAVMDGGWDGCGSPGTRPVGSKPQGNTRDGLADMAGNVGEWTSSRRDGKYAVTRGGSWGDANHELLRVTYREETYQAPTGERDQYIGFRCVKPAP